MFFANFAHFGLERALTIRDFGRLHSFAHFKYRYGFLSFMLFLINIKIRHSYEILIPKPNYKIQMAN